MTPWTVVCQVPLSVGFFRKKYGSGLPCPPPRDLPLQGISPTHGLVPCLLHWQVGSLPLMPPGKPIATQTLNGKDWAGIQMCDSKVLALSPCLSILSPNPTQTQSPTQSLPPPGSLPSLHPLSPASSGLCIILSVCAVCGSVFVPQEGHKFLRVRE